MSKIQDQNFLFEISRMFVGTIFTFSYVLPMSMIIYYYSQIVSHVVNHEKALKAQAKKMNVESLRSNQDKNQTSVEVRIAKACITVCWLKFEGISVCLEFSFSQGLLPFRRFMDALRSSSTHRIFWRQESFDTRLDDDPSLYLQVCRVSRSICLCDLSPEVNFFYCKNIIQF